MEETKLNQQINSEEEKLILETLNEIEEENKERRINVVNVNGNDIRKEKVNINSNSSKRKAVSKLLGCTYRTPPKIVAPLLEQLFQERESKEGHWLYVAQHWNPRAINRVIAKIMKQHQRGDVTIRNPAAYFTSLIQYRKKRRMFTHTNATRKQYNL